MAFFKKNKFNKRGDIVKKVIEKEEIIGKDLIEYGNRLDEKGNKNYQSKIIINKFKESTTVDGLHQDSPNYKCAEIILDTMKEISERESIMFSEHGSLAKRMAQNDARNRSNPTHLLDMFNAATKSNISPILKAKDQLLLGSNMKSAKELYEDMRHSFENNMQINFDLHTFSQ